MRRRHGRATLGAGAARVATLDLGNVLPASTRHEEPSPRFSLRPDAGHAAWQPLRAHVERQQRCCGCCCRTRTTGRTPKFSGGIDLEAAAADASGATSPCAPSSSRAPRCSPAADAVVAERSRGAPAQGGLSVVADQQHRVRVETQSHVQGGVADRPTVHIVWNSTIDGGRDDVTLDGTLVPSFYGAQHRGVEGPLVGGLSAAKRRRTNVIGDRASPCRSRQDHGQRQAAVVDHARRAAPRRTR